MTERLAPPRHRREDAYVQPELDLPATTPPSVEHFLHEQNIDPNPGLSEVRRLERARGRVDEALRVTNLHKAFIPAVTASIAQHSQPSTTVHYPTIEEIKAQYGDVRLASSVLNWGIFGWLGLGDLFDSWAERKARQGIMRIAERTTRFVDAVGGVRTPKDQFLEEVARLHAELANSDKPHKTLPRFLQGLVYGRDPRNQEQAKKDEDSYPYMRELIAVSGLRHQVTGNRTRVRAATPEIIQGIEQFLEQHGRSPDGTIQIPHHRSLVRKLAEKFSSGKLQDAPRQIEMLLTSVYNALPEDGERFKRNFYAFCAKITEQSRRSSAATDKLFEEIHHLWHRR